VVVRACGRVDMRCCHEVCHKCIILWTQRQNTSVNNVTNFYITLIVSFEKLDLTKIVEPS